MPPVITPRVPKALLLAALLALAPSTAAAHALLTSPRPRDQSDAHKDPNGPCGVVRRASQPSTDLAVGQTITVTWNETVLHPGCFLVDFSAAGDADFQTPVVVAHQEDGLIPRPYSTSFTLPQAPCDACTLRVRQLMLNDSTLPCPPPDGVIPDNVTYYTCANVRVLGGDAPGPGGDDGCGCRISRSRAGSGLGALALAVLVLVRRSRGR